MVDDETLKITELPVRVWTQSYKDLVESWTQSTEKTSAWVKVCAFASQVANPTWPQDFKEHHTHTTVSFTLTLSGAGKDLVRTNNIEKELKLSGSVNTSNMVCFDVDGKIKKYGSAEEILEDFYYVRMDYYHRRKVSTPVRVLLTSNVWLRKTCSTKWVPYLIGCPIKLVSFLLLSTANLWWLSGKKLISLHKCVQKAIKQSPSLPKSWTPAMSQAEEMRAKKKWKRRLQMDNAIQVSSANPIQVEPKDWQITTTV